jgi:hypothetical protein
LNVFENGSRPGKRAGTARIKADIEQGKFSVNLRRNQSRAGATPRATEGKAIAIASQKVM